jgi:carboxymethylenebutenolidase
MTEQRAGSGFMKGFLAVAMAGLLVACQQPASPGSGTAERGPEQSLGAQDQAFVEGTSQAHATDAPAPSPLTEPSPARPVVQQQLAYGEADNRNLEGFLAMPSDAAEPLPGLLVIHEWWGLNDNIKAMARRFAGEGYIALAVDLYDGHVADTPEEAQALMAAALKEPDKIKDNLRQAYDYLDKYALSPRIGSVGWCFGGGWSLQSALMLPKQLDAMVMYYGRVVTDSEQLEPVAVPMLGLFGSLDQTIPVQDVQRFRGTLDALGKDADIRIYTGAKHAFANPSGGNYDADAAKDAWQRTLDFLASHLQRPESESPNASSAAR